MKADHRKELQTNALADHMGKLLQGVRSNPQSSSIVIWVIVLLSVGTFAAWYFTSGSSQARSALWVKIEVDSYTKNPDASLPDLDAISSIAPGTMPGRTARFQRARFLLPQALATLCTLQRQEAIDNLEKARDLYVSLIPECSDNSILVQEALFGAAQAEETLMGVPKEEKSKPEYGNLDTAIDYYKKTVAKAPTSYFGRRAEAQLKLLEENREDVEKLYTELGKLAGPKKK